MSTIGSRIKNRREELGLSQDELGRRLGYKSRSSINKIELDQRNLTQSKIKALADALETTPSYIMGWNETSIDPTDLPSNAIPFVPPSKYAPILGTIPAGYPCLANEEIEGYAPVDYPDVENYFWLRVCGDSMINAGIQTGDLVLIRMQSCADNGQIVACRVNGDESTLKRFSRQGDTIMLIPENAKYSPQLVPASDFENGLACIIGVAVEIKRSLL